MKNENLITPLITILLLLCLGLTTGIFLLFQKYTDVQNKYDTLQKKLENPAVLADEEVFLTIQKVGKLVELPPNEKPILATVSDKDKLSDQPFFEKAITGDKVLVYVQAKKAVLYRPSTNKVINVAPVNVKTTPTPPTEPGGEENIEGNPDIPQPN